MRVLKCLYNLQRPGEVSSYPFYRYKIKVCFGNLPQLRTVSGLYQTCASAAVIVIVGDYLWSKLYGYKL